MLLFNTQTRMHTQAHINIGPMCAGVGNGNRERKLQMHACQATFCALPCIWFAHCSPCNVLLLLSESLKRMCYWCCWLLLLLLLLSPPPPLPLLLWLLQPFLTILYFLMEIHSRYYYGCCFVCLSFPFFFHSLLFDFGFVVFFPSSVRALSALTTLNRFNSASIQS